MIKKSLEIKYLKQDFSISKLKNKNWEKAKTVKIKNHWSGEKAPKERHAKVNLLWSAKALYLRFEAKQFEPLVISENPNLSVKTIGLWERDVGEIFIAPNPREFRRYFEFEVAPTGEWIDLQIYQGVEKRETDFDYHSGMKTSTEIAENKVFMGIKIGWKAFGKTPKEDEIWLGNLFRVIGKDDSRGYLAWSPTLTEKPNFHVPEKFGEFKFVK